MIAQEDSQQPAQQVARSWRSRLWIKVHNKQSLERVDLQMRSISCRMRCLIDLTIARQAIIASRIDSDHSFANKVVTMEQSSCIVKMSSFWQ